MLAGDLSPQDVDLMRTAVTATTLLFLVALAGCIAPVDEIKTTIDPSAEPDAIAQATWATQFSGTLEADSCTVSDQVNTCKTPFHPDLAGKSPPPHTVWHEVRINESIDVLRFETDWEWSEPGSATFTLELEWKGDIVAADHRTNPSIYLNNVPMRWFDADDDRLWLYFGVKPVEDSLGSHYPRVNVDYTITVQMDEAT